jgi:hypothetical protein
MNTCSKDGEQWPQKRNTLKWKIKSSLNIRGRNVMTFVLVVMKLIDCNGISSPRVVTGE